MNNPAFKNKRIEYLNNWPNSEAFEIEKKYCSFVSNTKLESGTIFKPFQLFANDDEEYNKVISFIIDALNQLEVYPNFSFEFIFKAYDCIQDKYHTDIKTITDKNKVLCDNELSDVINRNARLNASFQNLLRVIPVTACQYLYLRITDHNNDNQPYKRVTTDISGSNSLDSQKRREIVDAIESKYGLGDYPTTIRKASLLYRFILKNNSVNIDKTYSICTSDKLHFLMSGFLYTMRNDIMHGSSMTFTKSSLASLRTYASSYYAFLLLYYFTIILVIEAFKGDYPNDVYDKLAENIDENIDLYMRLFTRKSIEE